MIIDRDILLFSQSALSEPEHALVGALARLDFSISICSTSLHHYALENSKTVVIVPASSLERLNQSYRGVQQLIDESRLTIFSFSGTPENELPQDFAALNCILLQGFTGSNVDHLGFIKLARDLSRQTGCDDRSRGIATLSDWQRLDRASAKEVAKFLSRLMSPAIKDAIEPEAIRCAVSTIQTVATDLTDIDELTGLKPQRGDATHLYRDYRFHERAEKIIENCFEDFSYAQHIHVLYGKAFVFPIELFQKRYYYEPYVYETFEIGFSVEAEPNEFLLVGDNGARKWIKARTSQHLNELSAAPSQQAAEDPGWDIFISYARADWQRIAPIVDALSEFNLRIFIDLNDLPSGRYFDVYLEAALRRSKSVVALWSNHALSRPWVRREAALAASLGLLVPASIEPIGPHCEVNCVDPAEIIELGQAEGVLLEDQNFRALLTQVGPLIRPDHDLLSDVLSRDEWQNMDKSTVFELGPLLGRTIPAHLLYEVGGQVASIVRRTTGSIADRADALANSLNMGAEWSGETRTGRPPPSFKPALKVIYEEWKVCALLLKKFKRLNQLQVRECVYPFDLPYDGRAAYGFKIVDGEPQFVEVENEGEPKALHDSDPLDSWWTRFANAFGLKPRPRA